jgi:hypothetical protein
MRQIHWPTVIATLVILFLLGLLAPGFRRMIVG